MFKFKFIIWKNSDLFGHFSTDYFSGSVDIVNKWCSNKCIGYEKSEHPIWNLFWNVTVGSKKSFWRKESIRVSHILLVLVLFYGTFSQQVTRSYGPGVVTDGLGHLYSVGDQRCVWYAQFQRFINRVSTIGESATES